MRINKLMIIISFAVLTSNCLLSACVTNPDLSVIGQVYGTYTDDTLAEKPDKFVPSLGETEINLSAALNPYFNAAFVLAIDGDGGIEVEEAYAAMVKGLPFNLALKAGKYRLNFGKLNQSHPHAYPFIRTPRVLTPDVAGLIPGEESFNDIAGEISSLIPVYRSWTIIPSVNILEGSSFHVDEDHMKYGWLAHLSNTFTIGSSAFDIGGSVTQGTNSVDAATKTTIFGFDAKAKYTRSHAFVMTIGSEFIYNMTEESDSTGNRNDNERYGLYAYIDNKIFTRYNAGIIFEQYQNPDDPDATDRSIKPFIGFSVLEESTVFRLSYEYFVPENGQKINTVELQFLFSMGPHKAHKF